MTAAAASRDLEAALVMMKKLNLRPRRCTVRVGACGRTRKTALRGGNAYRDAHQGELPSHIAEMIESDGGVFAPTGFGFTGSDGARAKARDIATLLAGIHADTIGPAGGGADIGPSVQQAGIPAFELENNGNYFLDLTTLTPADTIDKIDPARRCRARRPPSP